MEGSEQETCWEAPPGSAAGGLGCWEKEDATGGLLEVSLWGMG
jgi:hypothetical protein